MWLKDTVKIPLWAPDLFSYCLLEANMNWHDIQFAVTSWSGTRPCYLIPLTFVKAIKTDSNRTGKSIDSEGGR